MTATLTFSDDFPGPAGSAPDRSQWYILRSGLSAAGQRQSLTANPDNVSLDGRGNLCLTARRIGIGDGPTATYSSAYLQSHFIQQYGTFQARIKTPSGQGLWPAFWMVGLNGKWPACGEIDVMEQVGQHPGVSYAHVHGPGFIGPLLGHPARLAGTAAYSDAFHVYSVEWRRGSVSFAIDGDRYAEFTPQSLTPEMSWPFDDQPMAIRLSLAVGGDWPGDPGAATPFPATMLVNWVRVYA